MAVGGHVAGAEDIVDEVNYPEEPKCQDEINAEILSRLSALEANNENSD